MQIMGKLLLRHEEFISHLRKDMGFILFFEQDKHSVLPSLMDVAKAHREKLDQGNTEIKSPLRTLLLNCLLRELLQRTQQVTRDRGGTPRLESCSVADTGESVELSSLGHQAATSGTGCSQGSALSRECSPHHNGAAKSNERRNHPQVSVHTGHATHRGGRLHPGNIFAA